MATEFELKYRASAQQNAAIMADYQGFREISMETTYYDTPEGSLSERRWTLRHRLEDGVSVCTLKTPGENGARNEWETECDSIEAAIPALCKLGAPPELEALVSGGVSAVCGARFFRQAVLLELEACTVELALDRGFLRSGIRMELLGEVEVELKSGSRDAAVAFARSLAARYGLIPQPASKYARALALSKKR